MLRFRGHGISDVGRVREHNEDAGFLGASLALVADGIGGAAAGEVASATAAYVVSSALLREPDAAPEELLRAAVVEAHHRLVRGVTERPDRAGMATTLTALATDGVRVTMAHVGDSRAYRFRDGALTSLSRDHTWVQGLVEAGELEPGAVRHHRWRHVVSRSLHAHADRDVEVDVAEVEAQPGDRLLVCSDGLSDLVRDERIAEVLFVPDAEAAATGLVRDALYAGGADNITCLVVDVIEGPRPVGDGLALGSLRDLANVVGSVGVRP